MRLPLQPRALTCVANDPAAFEAGMGRWSRRLAGAFLDKRLVLPADGEVLNAGCGTGALSAARARHWGDAVGTPGRLSAQFTAAGLHEVAEGDIAIRQDLENFEDCYTPWLAGEGLVGAFLVSLAASDRARLETALRRAWVGLDGLRSFTAAARMAVRTR